MSDQARAVAILKCQYVVLYQNGFTPSCYIYMGLQEVLITVNWCCQFPKDGLLEESQEY